MKKRSARRGMMPFIDIRVVEKVQAYFTQALTAFVALVLFSTPIQLNFR